MTTTTHSHKAWTDKGGHVNRPAHPFPRRGVEEENASTGYAVLLLGIYTTRRDAPIANIAASMGHTVAVHLQSYARFTPDATANLYARANE
jgi:hypothetical protein